MEWDATGTHRSRPPWYSVRPARRDDRRDDEDHVDTGPSSVSSGLRRPQVLGSDATSGPRALVPPPRAREENDDRLAKGAARPGPANPEPCRPLAGAALLGRDR